MVKKYRADSLKFAILTAVSLFFLGASLSLFCVASLLPASFCLLLAVLYLSAALLNGARIEIDATGISRKVFCFPLQHVSWAEVREVGICGVKVFNRRRPDKTGTLYVYFSLENMTDDDRFQMILRWPPKQIWFAYSSSRLQEIAPFWEKEIITYNTGDLIL